MILFIVKKYAESEKRTKNTGLYFGAHLDWFRLLSFKDAIVLLQLVTDVCQTDGLMAGLRIPDQLYIRYEGDKKKSEMCAAALISLSQSSLAALFPP